MNFVKFEDCNYIEEDHKLIIPASCLNWIGALFDKPEFHLTLGQNLFYLHDWDGTAWVYAASDDGVTLEIEVVNDLTFWSSNAQDWKPMIPDMNGEVVWG